MTFAIAHRGLSHALPENSLAAFDAALAVDGVHVVEVDVRVTHDGVPVCTHDATLLRTAGADHRVGHLRLAELCRLAPDVSTLADVLDLVGGRAGAAMLDVKVSRPAAIEAIERVVAASSLRWNTGAQLRTGEPIDIGTATFQSADAALLQAFRSRTGAGCLELVRGGSSARELVLTAPFITAYAQGVTIPHQLATRAVVAVLHGLRLGTYAYTVNDAGRYAELVACGVRGVYTDRVDDLGR